MGKPPSCRRRRFGANPRVSDIENPPTADCSACPFRETLRPSSRCKPGDVCVQAESGRQIDRFLKRNPELAPDYLHDSFWERRAIAVRYVPTDAVLALIDDEDEVVRRAVAYRLPLEHLARLLNDPDREVRITVADRLPMDQLESMVGDEDYLVRAYVAKRLPEGRLFRMICDPDAHVRKQVAGRLPPASLGLMAHDADLQVRRIVAERMEPDSLVVMLNDVEWLIRYIAAERAPLASVRKLIYDPCADVREMVKGRIG